MGIDATAWDNDRGDGRFVRNVARALAGLGEFELVLYGDPVEPLEGVSLRRLAARAPAAGSRRRVGDAVRLSRAVRRDGLAVFLHPSVYSWLPVRGVRTVLGIHDTTALAFPRLVLPSARDRALWRLKQSWALRSATRVFTVSEAMRAEMAARLGVDAAVVPEAPDPVFAPVPSGVEPSFVFAAGISPHKGVLDLLDAYATLDAGAPPLVVAGSLDSSYASAVTDVRARISELGLGDRVRLPGFVPDEELARLYTAAVAAVVPSLAEGFGLPAVEAAACGAPVVLSDIPAHRETLGDAALFAPPGDATALATHLKRLASDPDLRHDVGEACRAAAGRLSWEESARRLSRLVKEAASGAQPQGV